MLAKTAEIKLDFPVLLAGGEIVAVTMRRPIMRDMLKHNIGATNTLAENVALIADLCGMVPEELELFDTVDFEKLQDQLLSFRGVK